MLLHTALDVVVGLGFGAAAIGAGGAWLSFIGVYASAMGAGGMLRLRVAVLADSKEVVVRNRWRTVRVPIEEIGGARVDTVTWTFRQPAYVGRGWWPGGRDWEVGVIETCDGRRVECDALISDPDGQADQEPTPARMKVDVLNRWLAEVRGRNAPFP